jgi:hypothetical protein
MKGKIKAVAECLGRRSDRRSLGSMAVLSIIADYCLCSDICRNGLPELAGRIFVLAGQQALLEASPRRNHLGATFARTPNWRENPQRPQLARH